MPIRRRYRRHIAHGHCRPRNRPDFAAEPTAIRLRTRRAQRQRTVHLNPIFPFSKVEPYLPITYHHSDGSKSATYAYTYSSDASEALAKGQFGSMKQSTNFLNVSTWVVIGVFIASSAVLAL
eukprot:1154012-Prorocentrum_minimum.AAC.5